MRKYRGGMSRLLASACLVVLALVIGLPVYLEYSPISPAIAVDIGPRCGDSEHDCPGEHLETAVSFKVTDTNEGFLSVWNWFSSNGLPGSLCIVVDSEKPMRVELNRLALALGRDDVSNPRYATTTDSSFIDTIFNMPWKHCSDSLDWKPLNDSTKHTKESVKDAVTYNILVGHPLARHEYVVFRADLPNVIRYRSFAKLWLAPFIDGDNGFELSDISVHVPQDFDFIQSGARNPPFYEGDSVGIELPVDRPSFRPFVVTVESIKRAEIKDWATFLAGALMGLAVAVLFDGVSRLVESATGGSDDGKT